MQVLYKMKSPLKNTEPLKKKKGQKFKGNLKVEVMKALKRKGLNLNKFRFKYHKQSPYQKRRYAPQYVEQELWVYKVPKGQAGGYYLIMSETWANPTYRKNQIDEIVAEYKMRYS